MAISATEAWLDSMEQGVYAHDDNGNPDVIWDAVWYDGRAAPQQPPDAQAFQQHHVQVKENIMTTTTARLNYRQIPQAVRDRQSFTGNTMSARAFLPGTCWVDGGQLFGTDRERFAADKPNITYVVFSYTTTPIAWETTDGVIYRVTQHFSVTTSKHQSRLYLFAERA